MKRLGRGYIRGNDNVFYSQFRGKLPFDYYKEIIGAYRNRVGTMNIAKVEEYADKFKHSDKMMQIIELEVL